MSNSNNNDCFVGCFCCCCFAVTRARVCSNQQTEKRFREAEMIRKWPVCPKEKKNTSKVVKRLFFHCSTFLPLHFLAPNRSVRIFRGGSLCSQTDLCKPLGFHPIVSVIYSHFGKLSPTLWRKPIYICLLSLQAYFAMGNCATRIENSSPILNTGRTSKETVQQSNACFLYAN